MPRWPRTGTASRMERAAHTHPLFMQDSRSSRGFDQPAPARRRPLVDESEHCCAGCRWQARTMIGVALKEHLHDHRRWVREVLVWKLEGLSEYDVRRPLTVTGTNLLGLVKHCAIWDARSFAEHGALFVRHLPTRRSSLVSRDPAGAEAGWSCRHVQRVPPPRSLAPSGSRVRPHGSRIGSRSRSAMPSCRRRVAWDSRQRRWRRLPGASCRAEPPDGGAELT